MEVRMAFDARKEFQSPCKRAYDEIVQNQGSLTTRIKGYFNNQLRRTLSASAAPTYRNTFGKMISFGISQVPLVGAALSKLADVAMNQAATALLKQDIAYLELHKMDAMQQKGELLVASVAQKYCDALRKYEEAHQTATAALPAKGQHFKNCSDVAAYLKAVYYWRYRMVRLRYYHDQVQAYCKTVASHLESAERNFLSFQADLQAKGPAMFSDWTWHYANCTDECYWPEPFGQEISAPTNIMDSRQRLAATGTRLYPATAFKGYDANGNPILTSPRVPAKPQFQRGPTPPPYPPPKTP